MGTEDGNVFDLSNVFQTVTETNNEVKRRCMILFGSPLCLCEFLNGMTDPDGLKPLYECDSKPFLGRGTSTATGTETSTGIGSVLGSLMSSDPLTGVLPATISGTATKSKAAKAPKSAKGKTPKKRKNSITNWTANTLKNLFKGKKKKSESAEKAPASKPESKNPEQ